ncbi:alcohol dehydrogenase catalytic domain-containing protein, partial [Acidiphilium sp.]
MLDSLAIIIERPFDLSLRRVRLDAPAATDVVVEVAWSGVSTGTEKLIFTGEMPPFPGMGYPLVPGYEATGTIVEAGHAVRGRLGETVFV